jgi:hypothetical protein
MNVCDDITRIADATEGMETALKIIAARMPGTVEPPVPAEIHGRLTLSFNAFSITGVNMDATVPAGTSGAVTVDWVDAFGNPAKTDGPTSWQSSDPSIVTATVAPDDATTNTAVLTSVGPIGPAQVQATADADMGAGTRSITAVCNVTVIAGEAVGGVIRPVGTQNPGAAKKK